MRNRKLPFTCKDCPDRYPGCHDDCNKYKREKAIWDKQKAEEAVEKGIYYYVGHSTSEKRDARAKQKKDVRGRKHFHR